MTDNCGNCRFFLSTGSFDKRAVVHGGKTEEDAATGTCRRYPGASPAEGMMAVLPLKLASDYCGEHDTKETPP